MKIIGTDIIEAIDWTQDKFRTTRPIAEKTLFSLLNDRTVKETEEGFVLTEDETEAEKHFTNQKNNMAKNWSRRSKIKFHRKRKSIHMQNLKKKMSMKMDNTDSADDMLDSSENER